MAWRIELTRTAVKDLKRIDRKQTERILEFLKKLSESENPCQKGKALKGYLGEFWRYRVGDYRVICNIEVEKERILVLRVGHRKNVYRK
ncbi:type II toxin-antitoxin system RelE/ParE family toxin [Desulfurobacterium sp.]|uniref:type II toxin-antitoxin system RelE family toxin n=1 Tax=Desulfurobacterium sp. TaxID=2004706 RepID=UPI0026188952|nr:type II toxin-antitoxin system RelE/ParE family toxin [Desulfurobacterium sp.]